MTPHPHPKEYIITDEQLTTLHKFFIPLDTPYDEAIKRQKFMSIIRSRPFSSVQSERDKVLKEIFAWLCDMDGGDCVLNFELGLFSSPQPFNTVGLIHKLLELQQGSRQE